MKTFVGAGILTVVMGLGVCSNAQADTPRTLLTIKNQQFIPQQIQIPAHTKVEIVVKNEDRLPAEFESADLSREVVIPGHSAVSVYVGPLSKGRYGFFDDFNRAARGWVISAPNRSR